MDVKKELLDNLKAEGLEIAEESAKSAYRAVKKTLVDFIKATETKYDDLLLPAFDFVDKKVEPLLENINKEDNV